MKVNVLCDIIMYYVRVNQDKEVNMKNPSRIREFPQRSKQSSSNVYRDSIAERLTRMEAELSSLRNKYYILDRFSEMYGIDDRLTHLEEKVNGID